MYVTACAAFALVLLSRESSRYGTEGPLASESVRILGVSLEISPASLTGIPRNVPVLLTARLVDGEGSEVAELPAGLPQLQVRGTLSGPAHGRPRFRERRKLQQG